jgi:hypothetical protein
VVAAISRFRYFREIEAESTEAGPIESAGQVPPCIGSRELGADEIGKWLLCLPTSFGDNDRFFCNLTSLLDYREGIPHVDKHLTDQNDVARFNKTRQFARIAVNNARLGIQKSMSEPVAVLHLYDFRTLRSNVRLRINIDNIASRDVKARNDRSALLGLETQKSACAADIQKRFTSERWCAT